jgi:mono/diheme cytochrome c family protein
MRWTMLLVAAALGAAPAAADPPGPGDAGGLRAQNLLTRLGEEQFLRYCAACHGEDGRGHGPAASALMKPPADLTRIAARRGGQFPDAEIAQYIDGRFEVTAHGSREMPIWGRRLADPIAEDTTGEEVARGRIDLLVEYLRTIQVKDAAPGAKPGKP